METGALKKQRGARGSPLFFTAVPALFIKQPALFVLQHFHDFRTLQHTIFEGRVMRELRHRQSAAQPPALEHQTVTVGHRELIAHDPVFASEQTVDFLQIGPERLFAQRLHARLCGLAFGKSFGAHVALV